MARLQAVRVVLSDRRRDDARVPRFQRAEPRLVKRVGVLLAREPERPAQQRGR